MNGREAALGARAEELRRAFDRSFAEAPRTLGTALVDLLAIRVAGNAYAMRLAEVTGIFADRAVSPLPTPAPDLLGIAGFRASVVPVYDLRTLLGHAGGERPRWVATRTEGATVGFAFDEFDAHLRVPADALAADDGGAHRHVRHVVRGPAGALPILHLPSIFEVIRARATALRPKER